MVIHKRHQPKCEVIGTQSEKNSKNVKCDILNNQNSEVTSLGSSNSPPSSCHQSMNKSVDITCEYPLDLHFKIKSNLNNTDAKHSLNLQRNNELSQIKLMSMASGHSLKEKDTDDLWTKSRSLLRKSNDNVFKAKSNVKYHRNNFHLSLKDKWSKVMTDKISALAFSHSLQDRHHHSTIFKDSLFQSQVLKFK